MQTTQASNSSAEEQGPHRSNPSGSNPSQQRSGSHADCGPQFDPELQQEGSGSNPTHQTAGTHATTNGSSLNGSSMPGNLNGSGNGNGRTNGEGPAARRGLGGPCPL